VGQKPTVALGQFPTVATTLLREALKKKLGIQTKPRVA
jgi:hypothetical protein